MTLRHLHIFVTVFQAGGITRAALMLHVSQPSVSLAIRELEQHYGVRLFERTGRSIVPTECGKAFYGYALHIVSLFRDMEKKMTDWDETGTLRIGTSITIGTHVLPSLLTACRERFPGIHAEVVIHNSATIERFATDNSIDIGLIENAPQHPDIRCRPFRKDRLCGIAPPDHPLAGRNDVTIAELASQPLLLREKGSGGREILDACFSLEQLHVRPLWESVSNQAIIRGVAAGLGVSVLPCLLVQKDVQEGCVAPFNLQPTLERDFNIICHKRKYLTAPMRAFISLCLENSGKERKEDGTD